MKISLDKIIIEPITESVFETLYRIFYPKRNVSLIIPARNEANHIEKIIAVGKKSKLVDEVVVIDSFSTDDTNRIAKKAGARVIQQNKGTGGKGGAIKTAVEMVNANIYVFLDGDMKNPTIKMIDSLVEPILKGGADHTTAKFISRQRRVTVLTARPLLGIYFPEVTFAKPLSGLFAIRRDVIKNIDIVENWGVEIAKNIDVAMKGYKTKEVDIGCLRDDASKTVDDLLPMARDVARTILEKALEYGRIPTKETVENVMKKVKPDL